jgi:hypothetical protein
VSDGDSPRVVEFSQSGRLLLIIEQSRQAGIVASSGAVAVATDGTIYTAEDPIMKRSPSGAVIAKLR